MFRFVSSTLILILFWFGPLQSQNISPYNQGVLFLQEKNYEQAIEELEKAVQGEYRVLDAYNLLIQAYALNEQTDFAIRTTKNALTEFPENTILLYIRGELFIKKDKKRAISEFENLLKKHFHIENLSERGITKTQLEYQIGGLYSELGSQQFKKNDTEGAIESYYKALDFTGGNRHIFNNLIYLLILSSEHNEALSIANSAVEKYPEEENLKLLRYQALSLSGDFEESLKGLKSQYESTPSSPAVAIFYGRTLIQNNQLIKAGEHFDNHLNQYPEHREVYRALIQMNIQRYDYKALAEVYERKVNQFSDEPELKKELARSFALSSQYDKSVKAFYELYKNMECEQCLYEAVEVYLLDNKAELAIELLQNEIENIDYKYPYYDLLLEIYIYYRNYSEARDLLENITVDKKQHHTLLFKELLINYRDQNDVKLELMARNFIDQFPNYSGLPYLVLSEFESGNDYLNLLRDGIYRQIAVVEESSKTIEESAQRALSGNPDLQIPIVGMSQKLKNDQTLLNDLVNKVFEYNDIQEIEDFFLSLSLQFPNNGTIRLNYAKALELNDNDEKALEILNNTLEKVPDEINLHKRIANLHLKNSDLGKAILSWERVLSIDEKDTEAYRTLIRLHRESNTLDQLINRWQIRYRTDKRNDLLKEYLIEALHKADRFDEARELVASD